MSPPGLSIRQMSEPDRAVWQGMYRALFPNDPAENLDREISRILEDETRAGFLAQINDAPVGFAEYALRSWANGCYGQPVPFVEGIYVLPDVRSKGVARALMAHLEVRARAAGFDEIGSDALIEDERAQAMHRALGYQETERVVYFRKPLTR